MRFPGSRMLTLCEKLRRKFRKSAFLCRFCPTRVSFKAVARDVSLEPTVGSLVQKKLASFSYTANAAA